MKTALALVMTLLVVSLPVSLAAEMNLVWDANGNLISGDGKYREYDDFNQLWRVYNGSDNTTLLQEYTYDPLEERVLIKRTYNSSGSIVETVYYVSKSDVRVVNSSGEYRYRYIYQNNILAAILNPDGSKYFVLPDAQGGVSVVTNSSGGVVDRPQYDGLEGITANGTASRFNVESHAEFDAVLGDMDFHARRYDADIGIFTAPDTMASAYTPQSLNRYMYEKGNSYRYIDPTGHYEEDVHRDLTYFLAENARFTTDEANLISAANQWTDVDPNTRPLDGVNYITGATKYYHFQPREVATQRVRSAQTLEEFGQALHTFQDSYSHEDYLRWASHLHDGHGPDKTYLDPKKADEMARATFVEMGMRNEMSNADIINQWMTIQPTVSAFNRATTMDEKNRILSRGRSGTASNPRIEAGGYRSYTNKYGRTTRLCSTCSIKS